MDSSTLCFTSAWLNRLRFGIALLLALLAGVLPCAVQAQSSGVEVMPLQIEKQDGGLYLSTSVRFDLPPAVEDTLQKGVPLVFVADVTIVRQRWYWYDKKIATVSRSMRVSYQPLTQRWRLTLAADNGANSGLGLGLGQNFDSLNAALGVLQRFTRWKIADADELDSGGDYLVSFRFRLDLNQLPRPFLIGQIGTVGKDDWNISASRDQRLGPDLLK